VKEHVGDRRAKTASRGYGCSNVIYFPYINVPDSLWLTQVLLYWDKVYAIVPLECQLAPDKMSPAMRDLVGCGLVLPCTPGQGVNWAVDFDGVFATYVMGLGEELEHRRAAFNRGEVTQIHGEKIRSVFQALKDAGLARAEDKIQKFHVERRTARDFMGYLATSMGSNETLDASPVTDDPSFLSDLVGGTLRRVDPDGCVAALRTALLGDLLPVPAAKLSSEALVKFKKDHARWLPDFRLKVEGGIVDALNIANPDQRDYRIKLLREGLMREVADIAEAIKNDASIVSHGRKALAGALSLAGSLCPPPFSAMGCLADRVRPKSQIDEHSPLLYAAYAQALLDQ